MKTHFRSAFSIIIVILCVGVAVLVFFLLQSNKKSSKVPLLLNYQKFQDGQQMDIQGQLITVQVLRTDPRIILLHNFLSPNECKLLIEMATPRMRRSTVQTKTLEKHPDRTSFTCNLNKKENSTVSTIEQRATAVTGYPTNNLEPLQVVRYTPSQFYKPHYDYFPKNKQGTVEALKRGGQRTITLFVYLNDLIKDELGGQTSFPKLNLAVKPSAGTALVFPNLLADGTEDPRMLHGGEPPKQSTKYGLNIWFRQSTFV